MTERLPSLLLVAVPVLAACAMQPGEVNLVSSFGEQIAAVDGVTDFEHDGNEITFMGPDFVGPDGQDRIAAWRIRIESTEMVENDGRPLEGHVVSSWYRDGELVEMMGSMYTLPEAFYATGLAQECYAFWDEASNAWDW